MTIPFWKGGIRFECQGTGRCCVSRGRHLRVSTLAFTKKYCSKTDGFFHLKQVQGPCEFLKGTSCGAYEARPAQCRTWPFWPENMNARVWTQEVKAFCPGVGKGRLYTAEEIQAILRQDPTLE